MRVYVCMCHIVAILLLLLKKRNRLEIEHPKELDRDEIARVRRPREKFLGATSGSLRVMRSHKIDR